MQPRQIVLLLALAAAAGKLAIACLTIGTTDVLLFKFFGRFITEHGLAETYERMPLFNHTPLVAGWAYSCFQFAGDDFHAAARFVRLPGILADLLAVLVLLRIREKTGTPPWWGIGLFAASPVSLMVSGYHGNIDPVLSLLMLVALWLCIEGRPGWCGVALGLACQVKVVPLLLVPVFAAWWWRRGKLPAFASTAVLVTLAGWSPALIVAPAAFVKGVLSYPGYWGIWGISYILRATGAPQFHETAVTLLQPAQTAIMAAGKYLIIAGTLALAWWRRGRDIAVTLAAVWALFFVFATGVAAQYLVWCAPFILLVAPRWYAAQTVACALFLFHFYTTISGRFPWWYGVSEDKHIDMWGPWSLVPWAVFIGFLAWFLPRSLRRESVEIR